MTVKLSIGNRGIGEILASKEILKVRARQPCKMSQNTIQAYSKKPGSRPDPFAGMRCAPDEHRALRNQVFGKELGCRQVVSHVHITKRIDLEMDIWMRSEQSRGMQFDLLAWLAPPSIVERRSAKAFRFVFVKNEIRAGLSKS